MSEATDETLHSLLDSPIPPLWSDIVVWVLFLALNVKIAQVAYSFWMRVLWRDAFQRFVFFGKKSRQNGAKRDVRKALRVAKGKFAGEMYLRNVDELRVHDQQSMYANLNDYFRQRGIIDKLAGGSEADAPRDIDTEHHR